MGAIGSRVEALVVDLHETPWPESERLVAWTRDAGDDVRATWAKTERADDVLALAAAYGVGVRPALILGAALVREASSELGLRDARLTRVAYAAERGAPEAPTARVKLLDDAKALLVEAQKQSALSSKQERASRALTMFAAMEVLRGTAFLAIAVVSVREAEGQAHANVAHTLRQLATAFAARRLGSSDPSDAETQEDRDKRLEAATIEELSRLGPKLRAALDADFERAVAAGVG